MRLFWKDELVAYQDHGIMRRCEGVPNYKLPFGLFGLNRDEEICTTRELHKWADQRCFPIERVDASDLLIELGLTSYARASIVESTGAALIGNDNFWIDFETDDSIHSYEEYFTGLYH